MEANSFLDVKEQAFLNLDKPAGGRGRGGGADSALLLVFSK